MCQITAALNTIDKTVQLNSVKVQVNYQYGFELINKYTSLIEQMFPSFTPPLLSNSMYTYFLMENVCSCLIRGVNLPVSSKPYRT